MEESLYLNIFSIIKHYKLRFAFAVLMVLTSNALLILNPMIFRQSLNYLSRNTLDSSVSPELFYGLEKNIYFWIILLIMVAFFASLLKYGMRAQFISISREVEAVTRDIIFQRLQKQSSVFYDRYSIGEIISRLSNDIASYRDVLGPGIMYPLFVVTLAVPGLVALMTISPFLSLVTLLPIVIIPILFAIVRKKMFFLSKAVQENLGHLSGIAQEYYTGIRIIKGFHIETRMRRIFHRVAEQLYSAHADLSALEGGIFPLFFAMTKATTLLVISITALVLYFVPLELTSADVVSFIWIQTYILAPILMLGWVLPIYEKGKASYERLYQIYQEPIQIKDSRNFNLKIDDHASIEFRHLTFFYPSATKPALEDVSLKIPRGSFIGITGPVGSGKSTLFKILHREYEVGQNMVYIGEKEIHEYPLQSFYERIVACEQIPFLFSKTVKDNVTFGKESASQEEAEAVLRFTELHEAVMEFESQYDTMVGERGITLSGGQKKRIALARALLVNRSILLLDDVFSAVDAETENRIVGTMKKQLEGKTVFIITNRATVLDKMDRILTFSEGRLIEDGTSEELRKSNGYYKALYDLSQIKI
jgi:ATP-binding cassette subfamily B multidrug efflux pump